MIHLAHISQKGEYRDFTTPPVHPSRKAKILAFEAPLAVLRERVQARQRQGEDASEADVAVLDSQWAHLQPLAPDELALTVHVDTTQPVDWDALLPRSR